MKRQMALTRTPWLATQSMRSSSTPSSDDTSRRSTRMNAEPSGVCRGTPERCSATTWKSSLNAGDPDEPEAVSLE
jgi:hypothetical protein